jgi:hypothetical protein
MASLKPLKGAAYNIAHHAQSGLSCLYPYVGDLCKKADLTAVTIKLMDEDPYPKELEFLKPFSLAVNSLVAKFEEILVKLNLQISEVVEMDLTILFNNGYGDGSLYSVESKMVLKSGTKWVQVVV